MDSAIDPADLRAVREVAQAGRADDRLAEAALAAADVAGDAMGPAGVYARSRWKA